MSSFDAIVVGGGPAGATAATDLARRGHRVLLLDRAGRIKPCGGAVPPRLLQDFDIPEALLVARATAAEIVSPTGRHVTMPIEQGFVGMVDRDTFDPWLRARAVGCGVTQWDGRFERLRPAPDGGVVVTVRTPDSAIEVSARAVIGADGARSAVARQSLPGPPGPVVVAYHEIVRSPAALDGGRCDIHYARALSPDFYAWVFPHGSTTSVGTGSARKGFDLRGAVAKLRTEAGLAEVATLRREGAPIPLRVRPRWDDGRAVVLAGDAAGVVAPASGEGLYYAMTSGRLAAEAVQTFLETGDARALRTARARFMKDHGSVFRALGLMQRVWYANDWMRERFVALCGDKTVQRLVWRAYLTKTMGSRNPLTFLRIGLSNLAELTRWRPA